MFAVVKTGGKQYRVQKGDKLTVEKLDSEEGKSVDLDVLMIDGEVKSSSLKKAAVKAKVLSHGKGDKKLIFKKKKRQGYRRTKGHRQPETVIEITDIKKSA